MIGKVGTKAEKETKEKNDKKEKTLSASNKEKGSNK